ncbi:CDP-alcohol phosphatidyltransferase [Colletotrichum godetiae]|uniref:CDP-alcohol phosphatidyltransferase n=1 Tax=Colletotrichum godetiae TaxID=1209918 RepID=A0AAJ0AKY2_9PEZI|nr:CDP-alcohol phosphatidyltransferase [Colletotrichum godetiae]KAK1674323.1 CDP-alcohol phosphatidyltransferase [Colletotrichum godetiae]
MSVRQTRRQAAQAAAAESSKVTSDGPADQVAMNGNGNGAPVTEASEDGPKENIFLFWPNIIGYSRIVLAIASLYYMPLHPRTCSLLYSVSCLLDALDGYAARAFEQSTRFGAVLDMVTDRCTTSCLLVFLSCAFPRWTIVFQMLLSLDFSSHYIHMYTTLTMAGSESSHKNVDESRSWILHLYYTNKTVLFVFCALNELFFIALYLLSFSSPLLSPSLLNSVSNSEAMQIQAGAQVNTSLLSHIFPNPYSAAALELARANKMDSTWPWVLTAISFPVMATKQFINIVQIVNASKWLAEGDLAMRKAQGLPRKKSKSA